MEARTVNSTHPSRRSIVAIFEGPSVVRGRVSVAEFVRVLEGLQRAVILTGQEIMGRTTRHGPVPQTYSEQLTLELVATSPGSFRATLELAEPSSPSLFALGEDAIDKLLEGIDLELETPGTQALSPAVRSVVQDALLKPLPLDSRLVLQGGRRDRRVAITPQKAAESVRSQAVVTFSAKSRQLVGRLLEVDFKDGTAEIYDASGKMTRVFFPPELAQAIKDAARLQVVLDGEEEVGDNGKSRAFRISTLNQVDLSDSFWVNPSLDELTQEQSVSPITSMSDLLASSLQDENPDELLAELAQLRRP